jgi:hypothetical protein
MMERRGEGETAEVLYMREKNSGRTDVRARKEHN